MNCKYSFLTHLYQVYQLPFGTGGVEAANSVESKSF